jgi:hypothetical protein
MEKSAALPRTDVNKPVRARGSREPHFRTAVCANLPSRLNQRACPAEIPALSRDKLKKLLREFKREDAIRLLPLAARRLARWYPADGSSAERLSVKCYSFGLTESDLSPQALCLIFSWLRGPFLLRTAPEQHKGSRVGSPEYSVPVARELNGAFFSTSSMRR